MTLPDEFWIVVTEYDCNPKYRAIPILGPLVHETLCLTEEQARDMASRLEGKLGWARAVRVVVEPDVGGTR